MDACGVGALPDADAYGDAGSNTLGHLAERVGGLDLPTLQRLGLGNIIPIEGVPPADDPVVHGRLHPLGPGKESTTGHWELMGVVPQHAAADLSGRLPARGDRAARGGHRPPLLLQPPLQRDRGDRGLRRAPPRDRRGDPLHVGRLGPPVRRPRRRALRAGAVRGLRGGARGDDRRARRRPRDRAPVRGRAGQLPAPRGPARLRRAAARALVPGGASGRRAARARRGEDPRPVRRRRHHREARGRDEREGDRLDDAPDRGARQRPDLREPRRDRPGLRPPPRRGGLPRGAEGDRRRRGRAGSTCCATTTCWC